MSDFIVQVPDDDNEIGDPVQRAAIHRMQRDIIAVDRIEDDEVWYNAAAPLLTTVSLLERAFETFKWHLIWQFSKRWSGLPKEVTAKYFHLFDVFAHLRTGVKVETVKVNMKAIELFLGDGAPRPPFGTVEIIKRNSAGIPILSTTTGQQIKVRVEWQPAQVGITKLVHLRHASVRGDRRQILWDMAADPEISSVALRSECYKGLGETVQMLPETRFSLQGPIITATDGVWTAPIAEIDWAMYEEDEFAHEAILTLIRLLGIQLDEDVIAKQLSKVIAKGSYNDADYTAE